MAGDYAIDGFTDQTSTQGFYGTVVWHHFYGAQMSQLMNPLVDDSPIKSCRDIDLIP